MSSRCSTLPVAYHATTMSDFYHYEHGYGQDGFLIADPWKGSHKQRDALDEPRCYTGVICVTVQWFSRYHNQIGRPTCPG